jgi:hypothetical protein
MLSHLGLNPGSVAGVQTMEWTDKRMDDLAERIDDGFAHGDGEVKELRREMHAGFARVDGEIKELRGEMYAGFARVDGEIKGLRGEMHAGFARVDGEIKGLRGELHDDIEAVRVLTFRLLVALSVGLLGVIATLLGGILVIAAGAEQPAGR